MNEITDAPADVAPAAALPTTKLGEVRAMKIGGIEYRCRLVTFGAAQRTIEVRDLDEADQWDLAEMAGTVPAENTGWMSRAMAAFSVIAVDGVPAEAVGTREDVRRLLRRLGRDGVGAAMSGLASFLSDEAAAAVGDVDTAKNS